MDLHGKVIIITGGVRDIGREVTLKLARSGAKLLINYFNSVDAAEETMKMVKETGAEAILVRGDMTKAEDVSLLVKEATDAFGPNVDGLVNNAGGLVARKTLEEIDIEFWDHVMDLNVKTCFLMTKAVVPLMKNGGSIVNYSSQAGRDGGGAGSTVYATSKGAIMTFTRSMAKELGPKNIRVNAVCPGLIATSFHDRFTKDDIRTKVAANTPLRREGEASEVADLTAYLLSDESTFVTGANLDINGGLFFS